MQQLLEIEEQKQDVFSLLLEKNNIDLPPLAIDTLQVNITRQCNQACRHCHVDASPNRKEHMNIKTINRCLKVLENNNKIKNLDITGGAPELNPHFNYLVIRAKELGKHVMVRHNLTITFAVNPKTGKSMEYLPEFFAENKVEVFCSLPYYQEYFTEKQRGKGVFDKSIKSLRLLNIQGFGTPKSDLKLNLVYNPVGAFLPAAQEELTNQFKKHLYEKYNLHFNDLFIITNMPVKRFKNELERLGQYNDYVAKLKNAFSTCAAEGVMCRSLISVGWDGKLYDCDFNQMEDLQIQNGHLCTIFNFDYKELIKRNIKFKSHCLGCTAGAGSSCCGETA